MEVYTAITFTFFIALLLFLITKRPSLSLFIASMVMPSFVLYAEFFLPYQGRGASMWPVALFIGSCIGFTSAFVGVSLGIYIHKIVKNKKSLTK
jgi:hypothetical protein